MINSFYKYPLILALTIIIFSGCLCFTRNIELTNAWNGWSPVGFTWALEDANLRDQRDFCNFVFKREHLLNSLANWVYPYSYDYLSIDPSNTQIAFIIATTTFYSLMIFNFIKVFINGPFFLGSAVFATALALFTNTINCNLASFGQANLSLAQAYGVAIPLQILALIMTFQKRLIWSGIILALLVFVHISLGFMTAVVVVAMVLSCSDQWKRPSTIAGLCILLICSVVWTLYISRTFDSHNSVMNLNEWVDWERMMNYHFFPFDTGVFTAIHDQGISPFLSILLVAMSSDILRKLPVSIRKMWFTGIIFSVLLTGCGIIISLYPPSIKLVMLALHRGSGITLLLLLPIVAWHLMDLFYRKDLISLVLGFACIIPAFLHKTWGIAIIPSLLVAGVAFFNRNDAWPIWQKRLVIFIFFITIGYATFLCVSGYAKLLDPSILGNRYVFMLLIFLFIILPISSKLENIRQYKNGMYDDSFNLKRSIQNSFRLTAISLLVAFSIHLNWKQYPAVDVNLARSYLDAQLWAHASTDPKAVFMPDPGMPLYGRAWSEFSRRASFGSVRDWLHVPIAYHANLDGFREGVRRLLLLGINPYTYKEAAFNSPNKKLQTWHSKTIDAARAAYYAMSPDDLVDLANREGINFFIFVKNYINPPPNLVSVYENNHFKICAPTVTYSPPDDT